MSSTRRLAAAAVLLAATAAAGGERVERPRLALALSGGGTRGFAHIGVLKAFEDCGLRIDMVAGTSMGALIGALYTLGYSADDLAAIAHRSEWVDVFLGGEERRDIPLDRWREEAWPLLSMDIGRQGLMIPGGIVATERLERLLVTLVLEAAGSTDFGGLERPFHAVATDIESGDKVSLASGSLARALRASMALPGIFSPVELDGRLLVDGGLSENLPVPEARAMGGDLVVAVDVSSPLRKRAELGSFITILDQALSLALAEGVASARAQADLVLEPAIGSHPSFDFDPTRTRDLVQCGYEAGLAACDRIRREIGDPPPAAPPRRTARPGQLQVGEVRWSGARPASRRLARRMFGPTSEDETLTLANLEERLARVRSLDLFAGIDLDLAEPGVRRRPGVLDIHLNESPPFRLDLAARYDDKSKALGRAALTLRRPIGPFTDLAAALTFGERLALRLSGRHQRLAAGSQIGTTLSGFHIDDFDRLVLDGEDQGKLRLRRTGLAARARLAPDGQRLIGIGLSLQSARSDPDGSPFAAETRRLVTAFAEADIDTTDALVYPTRGLRTAIRLELSARPLGSEAGFLRAEGALERYLPIGARTTASLRARAVVTLAGDLPVSELTSSGGNEAFPGYPRDAYRGETLASLRLGVQRALLPLPAAIGRSLLLGVEVGGGTMDGAPAPLDAGGSLLLGAAVVLALDTRLGPFAITTGFARGGHHLVTIEIGPRF